jgi:putative sterol carrier protein
MEDDMSFSDQDEAFRYIGGIFETAFKDPEIGPQLADTGLLLKFRFTEPDSVVIVDATTQQVHKGEVPGLEPTATMSMKGETANAYWQGKVNLPFAMARGKITVTGNVAALLKLAPLGKKLYPSYVETLKRDGREDLIV